MSLIFAIATRSYLEWILFDFVSDKKIQIATALNFLNGNGISLAYAKASNMSETIYETIGLWPPGFALSIAPLIQLGLSPIRASIFVEIVAVIILFSSFYIIFRLLKANTHYNIPIFFFLVYGLSIQPFNFLFTSGLLSLSFCILAIYFLIRNLNLDNDYSSWFCLGIFSFLPSFFHFSYYPISIVLPILLLLYSFFVDISKRGPAIANLLVCVLLLTGQFYYQATLPSGINYLSSYHPILSGAPYWENLKMFLNLPNYLVTDGFMFKRTVGGLHSDVYLLISIIGWLVLLFAMFLLKRELYQRFITQGISSLKNTNNQFIVINLILSWVLILFLVFLSLRYPPENASWMPDKLWTYVVEARYFALVIILLPVSIIMGLWEHLQKPLFKIIFKTIVISGFLFSTSVNLYYLYKYGSGTPEENYARYYHHNFDFENYLTERLNNSKDYHLLYAQSSEYDEYAYYSLMKSIPILRHEELQKELLSDEPVKVLINHNERLDPEDNSHVEFLIKKHNLQPVKEFPDLQLKIYELTFP